MTKYLALFVAIAAMIAVDLIATSASARRWDQPNGVYCPQGTCNRSGGRWARNGIQFCLPTNCLKH